VPLYPTLYRHGTIVAAVGFFALAIYYDRAWRSLKHRLTVPHPSNLEPRPWSSFQYLRWRAGASVLCFLLAVAADTPPTFLDRLVGALVGLCGALFAFMFGFGLVSLWNLPERQGPQPQPQSDKLNRCHRTGFSGLAFSGTATLGCARYFAAL